MKHPSTIEQLRYIEKHAIGPYGATAGNAADEIERLKAALHNIGIGGNGERNWTLDEVRAVAWAALEPKP